MNIQYPHDQDNKLLEYARADMAYVERKVSDISAGGCCVFDSTCATGETHQTQTAPNHSHVKQDELGQGFQPPPKREDGPRHSDAE